MKAAGSSRIVFKLTALRPSLCCRLANGARPSSESAEKSPAGGTSTTSSPSSATPEGSARASGSRSG